MYEQSLVKVIEPVKKTTISRLNKSKKWKYGYDKEHDIVVISKTGQIGDIYEIQGLQITVSYSCFLPSFISSNSLVVPNVSFFPHSLHSK